MTTKYIRGSQGSPLVAIIENGRVVGELPCLLDVWTKGRWPRYVDDHDRMKNYQREPKLVRYVDALMREGRAVLCRATRDGDRFERGAPIAVVSFSNLRHSAERGLELDIDPRSMDRDVR